MYLFNSYTATAMFSMPLMDPVSQEIRCDYTLVSRLQFLLSGKPECHLPVNNLKIATAVCLKNGIEVR